MRVLRILEYEGSEEWIKKTLERSYVRPEVKINTPGKLATIKEVYCQELKEPEHAANSQPSESEGSYDTEGDYRCSG